MEPKEITVIGEYIKLSFVYFFCVALYIYIVTCQAHPVLVKKANQMCGSFLFKILMDPWPCVFSLPGRFVGDPASLACDNMLTIT